MPSFQEIVESVDHLSEEEKQKIYATIKVESFKKGDLLQSKGDLRSRGFYIRTGILRSYTIDEKGKEHIYMFGSEGWIVSDMSVEVKNIPASLFIDVVEDVEVEWVDTQGFNDFSRVMMGGRTDEEFKRLMRRVQVLQERVIMLMSASVAERYEHFIQTYPDIVQRVPQRMIASYLGVTPEALSKVKGSILKSK